jgi:hypothetical protein
VRLPAGLHCRPTSPKTAPRRAFRIAHSRPSWASMIERLIASPVSRPKTHFPPCGWFCRCSVQQVNERDLARYGFTVSKGPPEEPSPPRRFVNPRSGQVSLVPDGIDPGFAYNSGEAAVDAHAARVAAAKWAGVPPELAAAARAASIDFLRPLLTQEFGGWVDRLGADLATAKPIGEQRIVGALTQDVLDYLGTVEQVPASGAITITDQTVLPATRQPRPITASTRSPGTFQVEL